MRRQCVSFFETKKNFRGIRVTRHYKDNIGRGVSSKKYRTLVHFEGPDRFIEYSFSVPMASFKKLINQRFNTSAIYWTKEQCEYLYGKYGKERKVLNLKQLRQKYEYLFVECPEYVPIPEETPPTDTVPTPEPPPNIVPGASKKSTTLRSFRVNSSTFHVDIDCSTLLAYPSINDTISRGKGKIYLYKGDKRISTLLDVDQNINKMFTKTFEGMDVGVYRLVMELEDTYQDNKEIHIKARTQIRQTLSDVNSSGNRDASKHHMFVLDQNGNRVEIDGDNEIIMDCDGTCKQCIRLEVPKGGRHTLHGSFLRPPGTYMGGPAGTGAALELTEGVIKYDVITRAFPPGEPIVGGAGGVSGEADFPEIDIPVPDFGTGGGGVEDLGGEEGGRSDEYLWLDVMFLDSAEASEVDHGAMDDIIESNVCYPLGTELVVNVKGGNTSEFLKANEELPLDELITDEINLHLTNPFGYDITVELDFNVDDNFDECGGGGVVKFNGGGFEFWGYDTIIGDDIDEIIESTGLSVNIEEYVPKHEVVGGCNGSYADLEIKQGGEVVKTHKITEDGVTRINISNLFDYGDSDFDIHLTTHQKGLEDEKGHDTRTLFSVRDFRLDTRFELNSELFDSQLDFYINNELKLTEDELGSGEHYFDVKKGLNEYKFVFSTNLYDYNWDYVEIPWIRLTNWLCDEDVVTPYCEKGRGDECVEALIGCLLGVLPDRKGCIEVTYIDYDTGKVIKSFTRDGYGIGYHEIQAEEMKDYEIVGDSEKTVNVDGSYVCTPVSFHYRRTHRRCLYVYHTDCDTGSVLRYEEYLDIEPGIHTIYPKDIPNYKVRDDSPREFEAINTLIPIECDVITICYDFVGEKDPTLDCLIINYEDIDGKVLGMDHRTGLKPGELTVHAKEIKGYRVVGDKVQTVVVREIDTPLKCLEVTFVYEKIPLDCVIVEYIDRVNERIIETEQHNGLTPGKYTYNAKEFEGYRLVSEDSLTILLEEEEITNECKILKFLYEPITKGCAFGKKIWLFT